VVVDGLKALDPKRPIREADITLRTRYVRFVPILLQKSFCITDCKFCGPYVRRSHNHLRDYINELTGDFGNGLAVRSHCDFGSFSLFAGN